jgi:hypothetical protein
MRDAPRVNHFTHEVRNTPVEATASLVSHARGDVRQGDVPRRRKASEILQPKGTWPCPNLKNACFSRQVELIEDPTMPSVRVCAEPLVEGDARVQSRRIDVLLGWEMIYVGNPGCRPVGQRILPTAGKSDAVT